MIDAIQPVTVVGRAPAAGGAAWPVVGIADVAADGGTVEPVRAGPALPVVLVTAADLAAGRYQLQAGPPLRAIALADSRPVAAGPAVPVYVTAGQLAILYRALALAVAPGTLLALWPLDETSGTVANDISGAGRNAAYVSTVTLGQPGLGDGQPAARVAGTGAVNFYTAALAAAWNGNQFTAHLWMQVSALADWSDATTRYLISLFQDANNFAYIRKFSTANVLSWVRSGGGVTSTQSFTTDGPAAWTHLAMTVDVAGDAARAYLDGAEVTPKATGLGTWAGALATTNNILGASNVGLSSPWKGGLTIAALHNAALTPLQVARMAHCRGFVVYDGDSRMVGGSTPAPHAAHQVPALKALRYGFADLGVSGQTWADMVADITTEAGPLYRTAWRSVAIGWAGVNDAVGGADAPTIWARMQQWAAKVRALGYVVVLATEIDGQNAALNAAGWHTTIWPQLNALIRAGWRSVADNLADLGADARLQNALNLTYYNADAVHLTTAGYAAVGGILAGAIVAAVSPS